MTKISVGLLTVSDRCASGEREDLSGAALAEALPPETYQILHRSIVPDEADAIASTLREWADSCALILTTGGTGLSPRDVTPEATLRVLDRLAPGIAEALRADGLKHTPFAMLSRGVAGTMGRTLVVNLPGSPKGVREGMAVLLPILEHALTLLRGEQPH
ncbi:MAG: MogA/MoaB family molybdenum cofactor biosynthesis protein [Armatimonadetes bacterium]|nr:MogA/MoaB family molybdenum cofactor biosynthesis protein [Armatimonadota bacterium]